MDKVITETKWNGYNFQWVNESKMEDMGDILAIYAPRNTDYFNSPIKEHGAFPAPIATAPLLYMELTGDFVFRVEIKLDFKDTFDAGAILIYENENVWAKLAFEKSDRLNGLPAVVSVVTNRISDDCHGTDIVQGEIGFQVAHVDDCFAFHYTLNGKDYLMSRIFTLPVGKTIKIGLEAQAPKSDGGYRYFSNLSISKERVSNIREGK